MKILQAFWRYWKSLSVWFFTAFVVLVILAAAMSYVFPVAKPDSHIRECIDSGGTWVDEEGLCKTVS